MARLVLVTGATSGLGKSTLSRRLAVALGAELFEEDDIRTHPAFVDVMASFERTGSASLDQLLDAASRFEIDDVHVLDALFPYLPSLLAWGHDDESIVRFFAELRVQLDAHDVVELHLVGDPEAALERAARREGPEWLAGHLDKLARHPGSADPARSRRLLEQAPWPVTFLDADEGADAVLARALAALG